MSYLTLGETSSSSPLASANQTLSAAIRPIWGAIDAIPVLTASKKVEFKTRPLDFLFDLFDPIEDHVWAAVSRVNSRTGKMQREFFGRTYDMRRSLPGDDRLDVSTLNVVKRMRVITAFFILIWQQPLELLQEMGREGIYVVQGVARVAGDAVNGAAKAVSDATTAAATFFGLRGLGAVEPSTTATAAAVVATEKATEVGTVAAPVVAPVLQDLIMKALVDSAAKVAVTGIKAAGSALTTKPGSGLPSQQQRRSSASASTSSSIHPAFVVGGAAVGAVVIYKLLKSRKR